MNKKKAIKEFSSWDRAEQMDFLNSLHRFLKPEPAILKVPAKVEEVGLVLKYCTLRAIKYNTWRVKDKVHFRFGDKATRNDVLIGIRTL